MRKIATIGTILAMGWLSLLATAYAIEPYPSAECALNANSSALTVIASNGDAKTYACTATCRYKTVGQRPIQTFKCNYRLGPNAAEKTVCQLDADFAEALPTRNICEPR